MILLYLALVIALIAFSILLYVLLVRGIASGSGVNRLVQRYSVDQQPQGRTWVRQTVMVGAVQWKRCTTVNLSERGLYLLVDAPLARLPAVLIPWSEISLMGETLLYWQTAWKLAVGEPAVTTITVQARLFNEMQPWVRSTTAGL